MNRYLPSRHAPFLSPIAPGQRWKVNADGLRLHKLWKIFDENDFLGEAWIRQFYEMINE